MIASTGALLCGGESSRMGRDKALLEIHGSPLWKIQCRKLASVCNEVLLCGKPSQAPHFHSPETRFVPDAAPGLGPLSGLATALRTARFPRVLVLAVDMPKMTERFLSQLLALSSDTCGVVPESNGFFQGLCAVYPAALLPRVLFFLSTPDRSLHSLIKDGIAREMLVVRSTSQEEHALFENWNIPGDVPPPG